jgi:hypothetical protein
LRIVRRIESKREKICKQHLCGRKKFAEGIEGHGTGSKETEQADIDTTVFTSFEHSLSNPLNVKNRRGLTAIWADSIEISIGLLPLSNWQAVKT